MYSAKVFLVSPHSRSQRAWDSGVLPKLGVRRTGTLGAPDLFLVFPEEASEAPSAFLVTSGRTRKRLFFMMFRNISFTCISQFKKKTLCY